MLRDLGILSVNRVTAASGSRQQTSTSRKRQRIEKTTFVETKTIASAAGERTLKLFARGGQIGLSELDDTGEPTFVPLERVRTHRNADKAGTYRWYNDYRLPPEHGGGTVTVRLQATTTTPARSSTAPRTSARFRQATPTSIGSTWRRNDAESINRHLDDTLGSDGHTASASDVST